MDQGFDSLWFGNCADSTIVRVDQATGEVTATIALPSGSGLLSESSLAVDETGVWFLTSGTELQLVQIDPETDEVAETYTAPTGTTAVRAGEGSLWLTRPSSDEVVRVDPTTGEEQATVEVAPFSTFLAVGEGSIWALGADTSEVSRIDPDTDTVSATIAVGDGAFNGGDIAVGGGFVLARLADSLIAEIDPTTDQVVARFGPASGSGSVAADDDAVWVSAHDVETVWRLPIG